MITHRNNPRKIGSIAVNVEVLKLSLEGADFQVLERLTGV